MSRRRHLGSRRTREKREERKRGRSLGPATRQSRTHRKKGKKPQAMVDKEKHDSLSQKSSPEISIR